MFFFYSFFMLSVENFFILISAILLHVCLTLFNLKTYCDIRISHYSNGYGLHSCRWLFFSSVRWLSDRPSVCVCFFFFKLSRFATFDKWPIVWMWWIMWWFCLHEIFNSIYVGFMLAICWMCDVWLQLTIGKLPYDRIDINEWRTRWFVKGIMVCMAISRNFTTTTQNCYALLRLHVVQVNSIWALLI